MRPARVLHVITQLELDGAQQTGITKLMLGTAVVAAVGLLHYFWSRHSIHRQAIFLRG